MSGWYDRACDGCGRAVAARVPEGTGRVLCTSCEPRDLPFTLAEAEPIDPATDPALCVACYLGEHDRCRPPCDCTHDGPPAPRDGRYVPDEDGVWWPRDDAPAAWEACTTCGREYVAGSPALCRTHLQCAACHAIPLIILRVRTWNHDLIKRAARAFRVPRRLLVHRSTPEERRMHQQYRGRQVARRRRRRQR